MRFSRVICIVLDGVGVGHLPDAGEYGDLGSNSLSNTASAVGGINLPNMGKLGLGNIVPLEGVQPVYHALGSYGKIGALSPGKDSTSGHWEMMGYILKEAFPIYPDGFPKELVEKFENACGYEVIGNRPASGTEIIARLGEEHMRTGKLILYTSQDSVFQLAAHEDLISVDELYSICGKARGILVPPHNVARVIARPFLGEPGGFYRTSRRRDFSLPPPGVTVLDAMLSSEFDTIGVGKIDDLFANRGLSEALHTASNLEGMEETMNLVKKGEGDLILTNLVDFDMMWGHRNDARAYALGLEEFDFFLGHLLDELSRGDLLIITSDHGCDPTMESTDHSREYVPLLVYNHASTRSFLGTRETLADIGKTIACNFKIGNKFPGTSFLKDV